MNKACSFNDIILQEVTTLQENNSLNIMDLIFCDIYAISCFFPFSLKHSVLFYAITEIYMILSKCQQKQIIRYTQKLKCFHDKPSKKEFALT